MEKVYHKEAFDRASEKYKAAVIDAGISEFSELGLEKANINVIAKKAGVSVGLLYKYFDTKEDYFFTGGYKVGLGRKIGRAGLSFCADMARPLVKKAGLTTTDHFFGMLAGCNLNTELVGNIIKALPEGTSELMTHPGLSQAILSQALPWDLHWENELEASLSKENRRLLEVNHVTLTNFGRLD